jgi:hypothetical protein
MSDDQGATTIALLSVLAVMAIGCATALYGLVRFVKWAWVS